MSGHDDRPPCRICGEPATPDHGFLCCWCWVVDEARAPVQGHEGCRLAKKRIEPIRVRYRTAVEATRENCIRVIHELKQPYEGMPRALKVKFRANPEASLRAVFEVAVENLTTTLRTRIKAPE